MGLKRFEVGSRLKRLSVKRDPKHLKERRMSVRKKEVKEEEGKLDLRLVN